MQLQALDFFFLRTVFLRKKKERDVGFSRCCFTVAPTQNQSCPTMKKFLMTLSCFFMEAEIHVVAGKKDVFYVREIRLYYHKERVATEFIWVHGIFPLFNYTLHIPKVPLLGNIFSAHSKTLNCWLYSNSLFKKADKFSNISLQWSSPTLCSLN